MTRDSIAVPASLDLLDVVGNGIDCERFLWIRGLSDRSLASKGRIDLVDAVQRHGDRLLHVASKDGTVAATVCVVPRTPPEVGAAWLTVHARTDPGEPLLGDLVQLARTLGSASDIEQVRCIDAASRPYLEALMHRHGFVVERRWRRFAIDVPRGENVQDVVLPTGLEVVALADRSDLADHAFRVRYERDDATQPAVSRFDTTEAWLSDLDGSPTSSRTLVLLLLADGAVVAVAKLERLAAASERAHVNGLTVAAGHRRRGYGLLVKRCIPALTSSAKMTRVETMNAADNAAAIAMNERAGWTEIEPHVTVRLDRGAS